MSQLIKIKLAFNEAQPHEMKTVHMPILLCAIPISPSVRKCFQSDNRLQVLLSL